MELNKKERNILLLAIDNLIETQGDRVNYTFLIDKLKDKGEL